MSFKSVQVSYIYALPFVWERYEQAIEVCGWQKSAALTQIGQVFCKRNLEYYQKAADIDAIARGFNHHKGEHFDLLTNWGELPDYTENKRPIYGPSPLETIEEPKRGEAKRHSFSTFKCSARTSAVLNLAMRIERTNINVLMTRLMHWYYNEYFELMYTPQIACAEQRTISPELSL